VKNPYSESHFRVFDKRSRQIRKKIIEILVASGRGHIGSALSLVEILRVLFDDILCYNATKPNWKDRDRLILSKGHGCLALYVFLSEKGYFEEKELYSACKFESLLGGHPSFNLPGVEAATGALGHGLSIGVGMALAGRIDHKTYKTFVILGDGECQEGSIWEAAMNASKHKLDNLVVLVDRNHMQCFGQTEEVQPLEPFSEKWKSFGFNVTECDGHSVNSIRESLNDISSSNGQPNVLICHTVKGMGLQAAANNPEWHHKSRLGEDEAAQLFAELECEK
jgi:transketolase